MPQPVLWVSAHDAVDVGEGRQRLAVEVLGRRACDDARLAEQFTW